MPHGWAARAQALIDGMAGRSALVLGDVMLDHFLVGRVHRLSPEAPVPVVAHAHDEYRPGGAANVALNLKALGAHVDLVAVTGADEAGTHLRAALDAAGISSAGLVQDATRPTTRKLRVVTTRQQQVARVDYESDAEIDAGVAEAIRQRLVAAGAAADVIIVSDYLKGAVTRSLMATLREVAATTGAPLLVDPKIPHLDRYHGVSLVTPNESEAEMATHLRIRTDEDARRAAQAIRARLGCASVVITRGEHGMWVLDGSAPDALVEVSLTAVTREVSDVTGAGDTVIGTLALALAAGGSLPEGARLATEAAGLAVSRFGPVAISSDDLRALPR
jgi:D-glycero-beta-D-manno-heptose-7-phosphate kinase